MKTFYKGPLVWAPNDVLQAAQGAGRMWAIYNNKVYDLTDYFGTVRRYSFNHSAEGPQLTKGVLIDKRYARVSRL
jgi:hypothetical protein